MGASLYKEFEGKVTVYSLYGLKVTTKVSLKIEGTSGLWAPTSSHSMGHWANIMET